MLIETISPQIPKYKTIFKKIKNCFDEKYLTNDGKNLLNFENRLQKYFKSKIKPVVFCNGEMSLYSLIQAWKIHLKIQKCKAIVPSFTFSGTVNALVQNNIEPVFTDIDSTLTLDLKKIKLDKEVKFVIAASVYGNIPDIINIKKFCKRNKLVFILDNAPGFCSKINNKFPNNYNIDQIYSFHATKIFNSVEGGCAITSNKSIQKILKALRNFGQLNKKTNDIIVPGLNSKMSELSAIVGIENLKNINSVMTKRKKIIKKYVKFFKTLEKKNYIEQMKIKDNVFCNYFFYPIILKSSSSLNFIKFMNKKKIFCRTYYRAVHTLSYYKKKTSIKDSRKLSFTNKLNNKIIAIPLHSDMNDNHIEYLFKNIKKFFLNK